MCFLWYCNMYINGQYQTRHTCTAQPLLLSSALNDWHSKQMHTHNKHNAVNKQVVHMTTTIQRLSNSSTDRTDYLEAVYIILVPRLVWQMLVCLKIKVRLKHNPLPFLKAENNWFKRKQCLRNQAKQWNKGAARLVTPVMAGMPSGILDHTSKGLGADWGLLGFFLSSSSGWPSSS